MKSVSRSVRRFGRDSSVRGAGVTVTVRRQDEQDEDGRRVGRDQTVRIRYRRVAVQLTVRMSQDEDDDDGTVRTKFGQCRFGHSVTG